MDIETQNLLGLLILKWEDKANGCDVRGVMTSIQGSIYEEVRQNTYLECIKDLKELIEQRS